MAERRNSEIRVPFAIGPNGGIAFTTDPVIQAIQHLISIIGTNPPERVMRPTYGTAAQSHLFNSDDPTDQIELVTEIREAVRAQAPDIELVSVEPQSTTFNDGRVEFSIRFRLREELEVREFTIDAGGEVINA